MRACFSLTCSAVTVGKGMCLDLLISATKMQRLVKPPPIASVGSIVAIQSGAVAPSMFKYIPSTASSRLAIVSYTHLSCESHQSVKYPRNL